MAKQVGSICLEGTIGNIIFYKRNGKYFARQKGAPSKKRLKEGKEFENSRRASSEFGHASKMVSKLVQSCRGIMNMGRHDGLQGMLTSAFGKVILTDPVSKYGERKLRYGDLERLVGLDLERTSLKGLIGSLPSVRMDGQEVSVDFGGLGQLAPKSIPSGASHYQMVVLCSQVDEESGEKVFFGHEGTILEKSEAMALHSELVVHLPNKLKEEEILFVMMGVVFLQEVNGKMSTLADKKVVGVVKAVKGG